MTTHRLVIENSDGQALRSFDWAAEEVLICQNKQTLRLELFAQSPPEADLAQTHRVLKTTSVKKLKDGPIEIGQTRICWREKVDKVIPLVQLPLDSNDDIKAISRWTALTHAIVLTLLFIGSYFFTREQQIIDPVVVQVFKQEPRQQTVNLAERKIERRKIVARVASKTVVPKRTVVAKAVPLPKKAPLRTQVNVSKVGALGALGGMKAFKKGSAGFNVNAANASLGTSLKSIGSGGSGGHSRAVHGKALVTTPVGTGGDLGSGGYATRGAGGGRPGYGTMTTKGGSSGFFLPLEEEALIEGGLDKDQIAAIVQRHLGQIIYCYERGLQVQPKLSGRVAVHFVINGGGAVQRAQVSNSTLKAASVENCIVQKLRGWKFPKPYGNVNVKVTYPFVLRRVG